MNSFCSLIIDARVVGQVVRSVKVPWIITHTCLWFGVHMDQKACGAAVRTDFSKFLKYFDVSEGKKNHLHLDVDLSRSTSFSITFRFSQFFLIKLGMMTNPHNWF